MVLVKPYAPRVEIRLLDEMGCATYEFLEHALVQRSFGLPTPVVILRIQHERSVGISEV